MFYNKVEICGIDTTTLKTIPEKEKTILLEKAQNGDKIAREKLVMGNLNNKTWNEVWDSEQAEVVRKAVRNCDRKCWMIGSASPAMHKYIWVPGWWVIKHKFLKGGKYSLSENAFIK